MATVPCQYKTGRTLGQGTYAIVKECVSIKTGQYYACKVINKKLMEGREHMIRNEISVLKALSNAPGLVTLWDYFETQNNLYLVTDLCQGGELFDRICAKQYFHEHDAAKLVQSVTSAVDYLHSHGIVHRDLKPENLLFRDKSDDSDLLIADFGLSKMIDESTFSALTTTCGTPGYMAPEIFKKQGHGKPVDLWAIGVITYFLLCGYTPFDRENQVEEISAICSADFAFEPAEYWAGVSDTARDFIRRCLTIDPNARLTATQALQHPWLVAATQHKAAQGTELASAAGGVDLLPGLRKNFDPKKTWKKGITAVRAAAVLNSGGEHRRQATLLAGGDPALFEQIQQAKKQAEGEVVDQVLA